MQITLILISALTPVAVLLWYIYRKDKVQPEPTKWLLKAFGFGVLSIFLSFVFSVPACLLFGMEMDANTYSSIREAFADAFVLAAIPEELAKLIMLRLLLRKNPYFDEKFDGIVYAVCIGMGFAGIENVMYLAGGIEDGSWIGIGISRALFSIPGHFFFAVLMGYYYSLYHFGIDRSPKAKAMILVAPILAHGLFDGILFCMNVDEGLALICLFLFLYFFNKLRKKVKERINSLIGN
ncbi:MAG: PrsW family intramembrane metalloprotease [Bacteroides sp.]